VAVMVGGALLMLLVIHFIRRDGCVIRAWISFVPSQVTEKTLLGCVRPAL